MSMPPDPYPLSSSEPAVKPTRTPAPAQPVLNYGRAASHYAQQADYVPRQPGNPFVTIISQPRETLYWIMGTDPKMHMLPILLAVCVLTITSSFFDGESDLELSVTGVLLGYGLGVPIGLLFIVIILYLMGFLCRFIGTWFGGTATSERCRCAMIWGYVPSLYGTVATLPLLIIGKFTDTPSGPVLALFIVYALISLAGSIYGLIVNSIGIGIAHRFNAWLGFATLLIAVIFLMLIMFAAFLPIFLLLA